MEQLYSLVTFGDNGGVSLTMKGTLDECEKVANEMAADGLRRIIYHPPTRDIVTLDDNGECDGISTWGRERRGQ